MALKWQSQSEKGKTPQTPSERKRTIRETYLWNFGQEAMGKWIRPGQHRSGGYISSGPIWRHQIHKMSHKRLVSEQHQGFLDPQKSAVCSSIQLYNLNDAIRFEMSARGTSAQWCLWQSSVAPAQCEFPPASELGKYQMLLFHSFWRALNSLVIEHLCNSSHNQRAWLYQDLKYPTHRGWDQKNTSERETALEETQFWNGKSMYRNILVGISMGEIHSIRKCS